MTEIVAFLAARLLTKAFWLLVLATFFGVLMLAMRNFYRNAIFQEAASWSTAARWGFNNASRFQSPRT